MPPRLKSTLVAAFIVLVLYLLIAWNFGSSFYGDVVGYPIDAIQGGLGIGHEEAALKEESTKVLEMVSKPTIPPNEKPAWNPDQATPDAWKAPVDDQPLKPVVTAKPETPKVETPQPQSQPTRLARPHKSINTERPKSKVIPPVAVVTKAPLGGGKPNVAPSTVSAALGGHVVDIVADEESKLQEEFEIESQDLEESAEGVDAIYGTTLKTLNDTGAHEGFKAAALTPTLFWSTYSDARPYIYNPYPAYNSKAWKTISKGTYKPCLGPKGEIADLKVYSGHADIFAEGLLGSYIPLDIDSNLCFERETRLGAYGFRENSSSIPATSKGDVEEEEEIEKRGGDWDIIDWGLLQQQCLEKNANRYESVFQRQQIVDHVNGNSTSSKHKNSTRRARRLRTRQSKDTVETSQNKETPPTKLVGEANQVDYQDNGGTHPKYKVPVVTHGEKEAAALKHALPAVGGEDNTKDSNPENSSVTIEDEELAAQKATSEVMTKIVPRTAVLIRSSTGQNYNENDKENVRAMISELALRSGAEYEIFLLVQVKDDTIPIRSDPKMYKKVVQENIPKEFWNMTVLWNDAEMKELYPLIPIEVNNARQSQWLSVQKFSQDHPEFEFFWNWEFDIRYTGHYYNLLEKLNMFAESQPRKYLWERNERYYIPSFHGRYSKFFRTVEAISGSDTVWGPPPHPDIAPTGPPKPDAGPSDDRYSWGVGEAADYISLAPIFNPVNTSWVERDDVWGYDGLATPRRASISTASRCSKKLLNTMHSENLKGNHLGSRMAPQTVSLLHGLKAVFAPIPMFFDKPWSGKSLERFFNPGPKGVSGTTRDSPFSLGRESRFQGSTWHFQADPPMRLYNNWLGLEDHNVGGAEWEKEHGRICLPPMLLSPIGDMVKSEEGHAAELELPV